METNTKIALAVGLIILLCCCLSVLFAVLGGVGLLSGEEKKPETTTPPVATTPATTTPATTPAVTTSVGVSGRYIKLVRPTVGCLNLAEIVIKSSADGTNLSKSAIITKSSVYENDAYPNKNLNDDNDATFVHTSCNDAAWIQIDLGKVIPIYSIILTNRKDCCQGRTTGLSLSILDDSQKVVYTADPLKDQSGSSTPTENNNGGPFMVYTWTLPNKTAVGSQPLPYVAQGSTPVAAETATKNWAGFIFSTNGQCGPSNNNTACTGTSCCSIFGWCGGSKGGNDDWCKTYHGFDGKYDALKP